MTLLQEYEQAAVRKDYHTMVSLMFQLDMDDFSYTSEVTFERMLQDLPFLITQPYLVRHAFFETNAFPQSFIDSFNVQWFPVEDFAFAETIHHLVQYQRYDLLQPWLKNILERLIFEPEYAPMIIYGLLRSVTFFSLTSSNDTAYETFKKKYIEPYAILFDKNILTCSCYDYPERDELTFDMEAWYTISSDGFSHQLEEIPLLLSYEP